MVMAKPVSCICSGPFFLSQMSPDKFWVFEKGGLWWYYNGECLVHGEELRLVIETAERMIDQMKGK